MYCYGMLSSVVGTAFNSVTLNQGSGTCGPRGHLIWTASEFSLAKLEYNIASERSITISRYLVSQEKSLFLIFVDQGRILE